MAGSSVKSLSTIGLGTNILSPDQTVIKMQIIGEGKNTSNLTYKLQREIDKLSKQLLKKQFINKDNIIQNKFNPSKYISKNNHNRKIRYNLTTQLTIILNNLKKEDIVPSISQIVNLIDKLNPNNKKATYNQFITINYKIIDAYYNFKDPKKVQQNLLKIALQDSQNKLNNLLELLNFNSAKIHQIEEKSQVNLTTYREKINIHHLKQPTEKIFSEKVKITYYLK